MLYPRKVGVALGRNSELPSHVVVLTEPIGVVEGRGGDDAVGAEVGMEVSAKGVGLLVAEVVRCDIKASRRVRVMLSWW